MTIESRAAVTLESPASRRPPPLQSVQMLRAVAAVMVLLFHLVTTSAYGWLPGATANEAERLSFGVAELVKAIGFAGVDLFFVISGVVMVYSSWDQLGNRQASIPFLKRRIARIYPLYWVCTATVLALAWLLPELATRGKLAWPALAKSWFLWPQAEYPIVAVGWTLTFEMYFYLVFALLIALPRRYFLWIIATWGLATVPLFWHFDRPEFRETSDGFMSLPLFASPLALEFIAGCCIGWQARRGSTPAGAIATAAGVIMFVLVGGYVGMRFPEEARYGLLRVAIFGAASALVVYGCIALERDGILSIPRLLKLCGDSSYSLYLTHMYVLWGVAKLWPAGASQGVDRAAMTMTAIAACVVTAIVSYQVIERPLHALFSRLFGVTGPAGPGRTVSN